MAPILGFGSSIQFSNDGGSTYVAAIGQVMEIVPPNITTNDVDISYVGMANVFRLFQAGLCNAGDVELKIIFDKTIMATLYGIIRVTKTWKLTFADLGATASTWVFSAYLKDITGEMPLDEKVMANYKLKASNQPIFTAGT